MGVKDNLCDVCGKKMDNKLDMPRMIEGKFMCKPCFDKMMAEEYAAKNKEKIEREQQIVAELLAKKLELERIRAENDKIALGLNDIYEYDVVNILDNSNGDANVDSISKALAEHSEKGWRLVSTFTNEIGHTSSYSSFSGMGSGTNATIDQIILIFERKIAKAKEE